MRKVGAFVATTLALAGMFSVSTAGAATARSGKPSPHIVSITAMRSAAQLDIVVRTSAVPSTYRITERIYFLKADDTQIDQCGVITSLWSGAGTGTSSTQPYAAILPAGTEKIRVEAVLSQMQAKRTARVVDSVDSGPVTIPALPEGVTSMPMTIWSIG